ncbi:hypothetical protein [Aestuariivirga sp.]|jgi:ABC-type spermidine/putrescine transport system permease subunit II|uniref:hypothetical protein n=1 Tax=Aestuariivirga sp. TaxID=2650926 RepID=UPI00378424A4
MSMILSQKWVPFLSFMLRALSTIPVRSCSGLHFAFATSIDEIIVTLFFGGGAGEARETLVV